MERQGGERRDAVQRLRPVEISQKTEERESTGPQRQGLSDCLRAFSVCTQQEQRASQQHVTEHRRGGRPSRGHEARACLRINESQLVDSEAPAEEVFRENHGVEQDGGRGESS